MEIVLAHDSRQAHLAEPGYGRVVARRRALPLIEGQVSLVGTGTGTAVLAAVDGRFPTWTMGDPAWSPPT